MGMMCCFTQLSQRRDTDTFLHGKQIKTVNQKIIVIHETRIAMPILQWIYRYI